MANAVSLCDLVSRLQFADPTTEIFVDTQSGTVVERESAGDASPSTVESEITDRDRFQELPVLDDRQEIELARNFHAQVSDAENRRRLALALANTNPLQSFEAALYRCQIAHEWFRFRDERLVRLVREWLEARGIPYVDDVPPSEG